MARRVNKKFVLILAGSAAGIAIAVALAVKLLIHPHPEQFIAAAKDAEAQHNLQLAADNWGKAIKADPRNPALYVNLGLLLHRMGEGNIDLARMQKDVGVWRQALEIQPDYVPAVRELCIYWDQARTDRPNDVVALRNCRDFAQQLIKLDPNANPKDIEEIEASYYITTIEGFLHG